MADMLRFKNNPLNDWLKALEKGAGIYADISMVEAGVVKKGHQSKVTIFLGKGGDIAEKVGILRASAGVMKLKAEGRTRLEHRPDRKRPLGTAHPL
jgi:precorrin-8X/cobalt-precorrin-8 methylmutase